MGKTQPAGACMKPSKTELGKFIRARRLRLDLRQAQVAQRTGIPQSSYSALELGKRKYLNTEQMKHLATVLECAPADLYVMLPKKHHVEPKTEITINTY